MTDTEAKQAMQARLRAAAERWLGTPWAANSGAAGPRGGVACHCLPRLLYIEAGMLPEAFPSAAGTPNAGRHAGAGLIEPWLDGRPEFRRVGSGAGSAVGGAVGRLLGFRLHRRRGGAGADEADHLGVQLDGVRFIHVLQHKNTALDRLDDPTWSRRWRAAWDLAVGPRTGP